MRENSFEELHISIQLKKLKICSIPLFISKFRKRHFINTFDVFEVLC